MTTNPKKDQGPGRAQQAAPAVAGGGDLHDDGAAACAGTCPAGGIVRTDCTYWDAAAVAGATLSDLDPEVIDRVVARLRRECPRIFAGRSREEMLRDLRVVDDAAEPTVAGLVACGQYPQKFFPSLVIEAYAWAGTRAGVLAGRGGPLRAAMTCVGNADNLVDEAVAFVRANMRTAAVIEGAFRTDLPDWPPEAVREAVANAIVHRDYRPAACHEYCPPCRVMLFDDCLVVESPGGLWGPVTLESLGRPAVHAVRNPYLAMLLANTCGNFARPLVRNTGTGIGLMQAALAGVRFATSDPAVFEAAADRFAVVIAKRRRSQTGPGHGTRPGLPEAILERLGQAQTVTASEIAAMTGMSRGSVTAALKKLLSQGTIRALEPARSPRQRYALVRREK